MKMKTGSPTQTLIFGKWKIEEVTIACFCVCLSGICTCYLLLNLEEYLSLRFATRMAERRFRLEAHETVKQRHEELIQIQLMFLKNNFDSDVQEEYMRLVTNSDKKEFFKEDNK